MDRPRIRIIPEKIDYILEITGMIGLLVLVAIPLYYYRLLPDSIPEHFNAQGQPDSFGSRGIVWLLPIIGVILYAGLTALNRFPHQFNYPVRVTDDNAESLYRLSTRMIRFLKLFLVMVFVYLNYNTVMVGLHKSEGLGTLFLPVVSAVIIIFLLIVIYRMIKLKSNKGINKAK